MKDRVEYIEELRQLGLAKIRENRLEEAIPLFDEALSLVDDDEVQELLIINKAGALISMEQQGPEVQKLPQIIMRRRNLRHLYLAAYNLQHKYQIDKDYKRGAMYARIALEAAEEAGELTWRIQALNAMGNLCVYDSRTEDAIDHYENLLPLVASDDHLRRSFVLQNLGYCRIVRGDSASGIELILEAVDLMERAGAEGYVAESYIDLCYGYLEVGNLALAREFGDKGLALAKEVRQIRNAHYLLGEVAFKTGDTEAAEYHFDRLATFYPDFPNLKNLLLALDLRGMVNLKL